MSANPLNAFAQWLNPVVVFFGSVVSIVTFLLGAIADPEGLWNQVVNTGVDILDNLLPVVPDGLKLVNIVNSIGTTYLPEFGTALIFDAIVTISGIASITLLVKLYKLIPFKFT